MRDNHKKTNLISHDDTTENKTLNLNSPEVLEFYQNKIQDHSEKAFDKSLNLSYEKDEQNYINERYDDIIKKRKPHKKI